jgi:hypothetical protein
MVQFVDVLPQYEFDPLYYGIEQNTKNRCGHSVFPARRVGNDGYDTGRRFLGCPYEVYFQTI